VVAGAWLVNREARRTKLPITFDEIMNFGILVMFAGIAGGRAYYVAFNWDFYARHPWEIPQIWHGGLAIHGGLITGVLAGWLYLRRHPVPMWPFADAVAPAIMLGQVFGRFGNFMNGDAHGVPTAMPWGVVFPPASVAGRQFPDTPIHPVMLYELILNLLFFFVMIRLRRRPHRPGFIFCLYFVFYAVSRAAVTGFRADDLWLGPVRAPYVASAVMILAFGGIIWARRLWEPEGAGQARRA